MSDPTAAGNPSGYKLEDVMAQPKVIVGTCKAYGSVLALWHQAASKYWPEAANNSVLCTDADPELSAFDSDRVFVKQTGWCDRLISYLEACDDEFVVFVLDDYILEAPVPHETVKQLHQKMQNDESLGVIYLTDTGLKATSAEREGLFEIARGPYSVNSCPGLWRRTFLIETLRPFQDPWAWEAFAFGTSAAKRLRAACWGPSLYTYSFKTGGLIYRGSISRVAYERLQAAEIPDLDISSIQGFKLEEGCAPAKRSLKWKLRFLRAGMRVSISTVAEFVASGFRVKLVNNKHALLKRKT